LTHGNTQIMQSLCVGVRQQPFTTGEQANLATHYVLLYFINQALHRLTPLKSLPSLCAY
jgi:hypothetical protein